MPTQRQQFSGAWEERKDDRGQRLVFSVRVNPEHTKLAVGNNAANAKKHQQKPMNMEGLHKQLQHLDKDN